MIVSKDADFFQRAVLYGPPPKVVWLGIGNGPTRIAEAVLRRYVDAVEAFGVDERSAWLRLPA